VRVEVATHVGGGVLAASRRAARERHGQGGALPEVLVVDLGDRGSVTVAQVGFHAVELGSLGLQGPGLGEAEVDLKEDYEGAITHC